jgi:hypothetical protein
MLKTEETVLQIMDLNQAINVLLRQHGIQQVLRTIASVTIEQDQSRTKWQGAINLLAQLIDDGALS